MILQRASSVRALSKKMAKPIAADLAGEPKMSNGSAFDGWILQDKKDTIHPPPSPLSRMHKE